MRKIEVGQIAYSKVELHSDNVNLQGLSPCLDVRFMALSIGPLSELHKLLIKILPPSYGFFAATCSLDSFYVVPKKKYKREQICICTLTYGYGCVYVCVRACIPPYLGKQTRNFVSTYFKHLFSSIANRKESLFLLKKIFAFAQ